MKMTNDLERIAELRKGLAKSSEGNIAAQTVLSVTCAYLGHEKNPTVAGMQALFHDIWKSAGKAIQDVDAALRVDVAILNDKDHPMGDKAVTMVLQSIRVCFGGVFPRPETREALFNLSKIAEIMDKALGRDGE